MALDGVFLRHIKNELQTALADSRVDKVYQPSNDEIVLTMRSRDSGSKKLLLSARANSPRINITSQTPENPQTPPMLCMLLRKRLAGARLREIRQPELERILFLDFEGKNELGDTVMMTLAVEIMAQYSNVIFIDGEGMIIDALKRVDPTMSSKRLVLPNVRYELPPKQNKLNMLEVSAEEILSAIKAYPKNADLSKAILATVQGVSPIICREVAHLTGRGNDVFSKELTAEDEKRLLYFLNRTIETAKNISGSPILIKDNTGKPTDISFLDITQYGNSVSIEHPESFCSLLDEFYSRRDSIERMRARSQDLSKLLTNLCERISRKIIAQQAELTACVDREHLRICGDILEANLYRIKKGDEFCEAENFYDENLAKIKIKLNPALSPTQNAQKYYKDYRKAKTAEQMLKVQLEKAHEELQYLEAVLDSLGRAETERELNEIRTELAEQGYIRTNRKKQKKEATLPPLEYKSKSGFTILVGRNNRQNDKLTLKQADKNDLWFHTKEIPGSHTIIVTNGQTPDDDTILYAASLAAYHSKARNAGKVPVDYTKIRYVSKPQGSKPGMVIYVNQKTLYVEPMEN